MQVATLAQFAMRLNAVELLCRHLLLIGALFAAFASPASAANNATLTVTKPLAASTVASEFSSLTLTCQFSPTPGYVIWSFAPPGQPIRTLVWCQPAKNICGPIGDVPEFANATASPNGSLTIPSLGQSHSGRYKCEALLQLYMAKTEANVSVLIAPTLPLIAAGRPQAVEGSSLSLSCSTSGGNPPPSLIWLVARAGRMFQAALADPTSTAPPAVAFGNVVSTLTLTGLSAIDNRAAVRCQTLHPVANLTSADFILNVLFKPTVKPMPHLAMELDTDLMIECSASGNPEPSVHLENSAGEILSAVSPSSVRYQLAVRQKAQSGVYRCAAANALGSAASAFSLDVQFGPQVSGAGLVTARVGDRLTTECTVDANPPASGPVAWTHTASGRTLTTASRQLVIDRVGRTDAGSWRCLFRNTLTPSNGVRVERQGFADTTVIVEYPPGLPAASADRRQLLSGDNASVACSANGDSPGVPAPTFRWSKSGSLFIASGPTLVLTNVSLADSGVYFCTPANSAGQGPSTSVVVDVEQAPDWVEKQPREPITVQVTSLDFRLVCTAQAKPEASFSWYKDGRIIAAEFYTVETASEPTTSGGYITTSLLKFRGTQRSMGLRPEDNGLYLCEAANKRGKISSQIALMVDFQPKIVSAETKIAKPPAGSVDFVCPVIGQPRPSITWQYSGNGTSPAGRFESDPGVPYRYLSRLERVTGLGSYTCLAANSIGSTRAVFQVVNPTVPDPPALLIVVAAGWDFVTLTWQPAFSGGSPVQYWVRVLCYDSAGQIRALTRRCDTSAMTNVTGLFPGTNYSIQIYGINDLGQSNYSSPVSIVTASLSLPKPTRVQLTTDGRLTVTSLPGYCTRIEASDDGGNTWTMYQYCLPSGTSHVSGVNRNLLYRALLCLTQREEVCGLPTLSTSSMSSLPEIHTSTIGIVGASCGVLIIVLTSVLTYFCCKRPAKTYKEMGQVTAQVRQPSPTTQPHYQQVSDGSARPYAMVPPHQSFSADDIAAVAAAANSSGGSKKPLMTTSHSESSRRSSALAKDDAVTSVEIGASALHHDRRSSATVVFATLRSGHNPLDSSASNPVLFNYPRDSHYPDDNRNTDPYTFEGSCNSIRQQKRIVYEVVV